MADDLTHPETKRFWELMLQRHRKERGDGPVTQEGTRWHALDEFDLKISLTVGSKGVRVFIRGEASAKPAPVWTKLAARQAELEAAIGVPMDTSEHGRFFIDSLRLDLLDETNRPSAVDWLFERSQAYEAALSGHLRRWAR